MFASTNELNVTHPTTLYQTRLVHVNLCKFPRPQLPYFALFRIVLTKWPEQPAIIPGKGVTSRQMTIPTTKLLEMLWRT